MRGSKKSERTENKRPAIAAAALDRWLAAETSRRRAVEARKKSANALHTAQQNSDDNLLKRVEDFDKQVHSITMREDSFVLGGDGWFRDFRQAMEKVITAIAE